MKGMIFNQLEAMVCDVAGPDAWDAILSSTTLKTHGGAFVGPKTYPDEDLTAIVVRASELTKTPVPDLVRAFGERLFPALAAAYPSFLSPGMGARSLLRLVDRVIHVEVRKLVPGAELPTFRYEEPAADELVMIYESPRKLCDLAKGLVTGVAKHFGERITLAEPACMHRGAPACRLELTFDGKA